MITKLTPQQEAQIPIYINDIIEKWSGKYYEQWSDKKAIKAINYIYKLCKFKQPIILIFDNPLFCQAALHVLKTLKSSKELNIESWLSSQLGSQLESQLGSQLWSQLWSQLGSQLESQLESQLWRQLESQLRSQLWSQLESQLRSQLWSHLRSQKISYENAFNIWAEPYQDIIYGYYNYLKTELKLKGKINKLFEEFFSLTSIGISSTIFTKSVCFISKPPKNINWNFRKQLHSELQPSIEFENWKLYHWNGVSVPEKLIITPEKITKTDILKEDNAEVRRCYMEKLGAEKYYQLICGGTETIDEDLDEYQKPMKLLRSKEKDTLLNDHVYVLSLTDTSTDRIYNLYPRIDLFPEAKKNVYAARASTFAVKTNNYNLISQS